MVWCPKMRGVWGERGRPEEWWERRGRWGGDLGNSPSASSLFFFFFFKAIWVRPALPSPPLLLLPLSWPEGLPSTHVHSAASLQWLARPSSLTGAPSRSRRPRGAPTAPPQQIQDTLAASHGQVQVRLLTQTSISAFKIRQSIGASSVMQVEG